MKPILFNTEMVRAILDGRKTVTRRVVKETSPQKFPYQPGDILWVRETWCQPAKHIFWYRADSPVKNLLWRPSIHMPKEAARIFLQVKKIKIERLQDITEEQTLAEGCSGVFYGNGSNIGSGWDLTPQNEFTNTWNKTIKKSNLDRYGWNANPFVFVIEFERIEK